MTHNCAEVFVLSPFGPCGLTCACKRYAKREVSEVQTEIGNAIGTLCPLQHLLGDPQLCLGVHFVSFWGLVA